MRLNWNKSEVEDSAVFQGQKIHRPCQLNHDCKIIMLTSILENLIKSQTDYKSLDMTYLVFLFSALLRNCSERQYNAVFYLTKYTDRYLLYTHSTATHLSVHVGFLIFN